MVKFTLNRLFLFTFLFLSTCGTVEHNFEPLDEIEVTVGETISINLHDLGISNDACNYSIKEILEVEQLIKLNHIKLTVMDLNDVQIKGLIRGFTQLKIQYEICSQDPLFRNTYIKYLDVFITD